MSESWREAAREEIESINPSLERRYGWDLTVEEEDDHLDLYVHYRRSEAPTDEYILRLRYQEGFQVDGRAETFVNPDDFEEEGLDYWPSGQAFKHGRSAICLAGTRGFHSKLHTGRDGREARLSQLLLDIQRCIEE